MILPVPLLSIVLLVAAPGDAPDEVDALQRVMQNAIARIEPSVVTVTTVGGIRKVEIPDDAKSKMTVPERPRGDGDDTDREREEDGGENAPEGRTPRFKNEWEKMLAMRGFKKAEGPTTGVVISSDGYLVTSAWNFDSDPQVVVVTTSGGGAHAARLLGIDRASGLALLKIDAEGLAVPEFLDPEEVEVGSWAFAIGRAIVRRGVEIKYGIVSAKNRIQGNALQTDAATSPTNYGGPLVDAEGRVYGILVPLGARGQETNPNWYDSGIGFAAPIPDPRRLIERLGEPGTVLLPAFLGVVMDQDRTEPGAAITKIAPNGPAAAAGLRKGDVVVRCGDENVENAFTLRFAIGRRRAGDKLPLEIRRGEETISLEVTLTARPEAAEEEEKLPIPIPDRGGDNRDR